MVAMSWPEALYCTTSEYTTISAIPTISGPSSFSADSSRVVSDSVRRALSGLLTSSRSHD